MAAPLGAPTHSVRALSRDTAASSAFRFAAWPDATGVDTDDTDTHDVHGPLRSSKFLRSQSTSSNMRPSGGPGWARLRGLL